MGRSSGLLHYYYHYSYPIRGREESEAISSNGRSGMQG